MAHLKSMVTAVVFTVVAVGFAFAMPAILNTAARVPAEHNPVATHSVSPTPTPTATVAAVEEEEKDEDEGAQGDNHGAAVSTAAHCPIKGMEHGELVRSIAQDKDATVADAEEACEAALEAAATEVTETKGKPERAERVKAPKPPKPPKPAKPTTDTLDDSTASDDTVEDAESGGPRNGKGRGKP